MSIIAKERITRSLGADYQPTEEQEQAAIFEWVTLMQPQIPELADLFHIPNGGWRAPATAAKLKAQGVKPGVSDLMLPVARGGYHGLWIELKRRKGGKVSPHQSDWITEMRFQGYRAEVCHGSEEACDLIYRYLMEADYGDHDTEAAAEDEGCGEADGNLPG